jgi:hypothetical protein
MARKGQLLATRVSRCIDSLTSAARLVLSGMVCRGLYRPEPRSMDGWQGAPSAGWFDHFWAKIWGGGATRGQS